MSARERTLWIVDDDPGYRDLLERVLAQEGRRIRRAGSAEQALAAMGEIPGDLILLDMRMPGMGGLGFLREIAGWQNPPPVLVLTAFAEVTDAVQAMKLGARDYLSKPVDLLDLCQRVQHLLDEPVPEDQNPVCDLPDSIVAQSPVMRDLLGEIQRVAQTQASVLLRGESGTGKDVVARFLHDSSPRSAAPFVGINVATLPESLVESELFGHARGAFTGAHQKQDGWIRAASAGSLFLDEIAEMPLALQPKMLRVLEDKKVTRLGETRAEDVDFRLISASHEDLQDLVRGGRFRADLYYRLAVVVFEIPPLRERQEDILPLAQLFLRQATQESKRLSPDTQERLLASRWPGNIRELRNAITRAAILSPGALILPEHLPPSLHRGRPPDAAAAPDLASLEKRAILDSLHRNRGNRTQAAAELGISRRKLLYRLKEYGVGREDRSLED